MYNNFNQKINLLEKSLKFNKKRSYKLLKKNNILLLEYNKLQEDLNKLNNKINLYINKKKDVNYTYHNDSEFMIDHIYDNINIHTYFIYILFIIFIIFIFIFIQ